MGIYLSKPSTEVEIDEADIHTDISYVAGEMQGWRKNMEDDYIAEITIPSLENASLFAVFGHSLHSFTL